MAKKILFVTTNVSKINDELETGVYFEEFVIPYLTFKATGYEVTVASPLGGVSPVDPDSYSCSSPMEWDSTKKYLDKTLKLDKVNHKNFDAIFLPGGHGAMFDLANNQLLGKLISEMYADGKIISAVCHGPAGFLKAKQPDGRPLVNGKKVTCFTNQEERIVKKVEFMPFLLENRFKELGADFEHDAPWSEFVVVDGNLITGQNQKSTLLVTEQVINNL